MKYTRLLRGVVVVLTLAVLTAGCGGGGSGGGGGVTALPALTSIKVTPADSTIAVVQHINFSAIGTYADSSTQDLTARASWASSAGSVATVSDAAGSKGTATANAVGTANITASFGGFSNQTNLTVTDPAPVSISVTPANSTTSVGSVIHFSAIGTYADNTSRDLTASASWISSVGPIASVSDAAGSKGTATANAAGTVTISSTFRAVANSTSLTVINPAANATLVSLTVTPGTSAIIVGSVLHFSAIGAYSNGSNQDLTAGASWASSAGSVATVSDAAGSKGTATANAVGTANISASLGGFSNQANLTVTGGAAANVMSVTVNGSLCSAATSAKYLNKPCVSVTICNPGTATCQTVNDILLDTGSYGLRIFKQAIPNLTLPSIASGSGSLAACIQFADGTSLWGPIQLADVQLANEPAVQIPIHVIDTSFGTRPIQCILAEQTPASAGLTGILGVGVFAQDCGPPCTGSASNGIYYSCIGSSCGGAAVSLANQVQNPVAKLPQDNNGILVQLPEVPSGGVSSITGSLILGIGTQPNNAAASPTVFPTDLSGDFGTVYFGSSSISFLDTGSNGLFFPSSDPLLLLCPAPYSAWYCPPATWAYSADTFGDLGTPSEIEAFSVGNFLALITTPNKVFNELAGPLAFGFDWGLPFFMGRKVYLGLEGKAGLGTTGPYVAY